MPRLAALTLMLALGACATAPIAPPPKAAPTVVVDNDVAVPTSCVAQGFPGRRTFTDTRAALKAAPDVAARYALMASNWEARDARLNADEDQIDICRAPAQTQTQTTPAGPNGR